MFEIPKTYAYDTLRAKVTPLLMDGKPIFVPSEIEEVLGYTDLAHAITLRKAFIKDTDYILLGFRSNPKLNDLKLFLKTSDKMFPLYERVKFAATLLLLTESGVTKLLNKRREKSALSYIYFISACENTLVKIGITGNIDKRFQGLLNTSPVPIKLLFYIEGTFGEEQQLHSKLRKYHSHGEWFHLTKEVKKCIRGLKRKRGDRSCG